MRTSPALSPEPRFVEYISGILLEVSLGDGNTRNASKMEPYPSEEARNRAVLVRNITHAATGTAIDDFFSFCGAIESKRVRTVAPVGGAAHPTLEAVVVFADDAARNTALMMNDSIIVDQPVTIVAVPHHYDFNATVAPPEVPRNTSNGIMGDLGGFFSAFTSTMNQAVRVMDEATNTGMLREAKDGMRSLHIKTMEVASEIDDRYHVKNTLLNAAEAGKTTAASLIQQTKSVASQVDNQYQISSKTSQTIDKALENPTVKNAQRSIKSGFDSILHTAGIDNSPNPLPPSEQTNTAPPQNDVPPTAANGAPAS